MRKIYTIFSLLISLWILGGCSEDKGNYDYKENIGEVLIKAIPGVTDQNNSFICLENETVRLNPELVFAEGTKAEDYEFEWSRYYKVPQGAYGHYVQPEIIGTAMNLEYKIQETPQDYWAVFKAKNKQTGATTELKFSFVISPLTGWAVLDEDATGSGDMHFIRDADIVVGGNGSVVRNHFSQSNGGVKIQKGKFFAYCPNSSRNNWYVFSEGGGYVMNSGTYKLVNGSSYVGLFNPTVGTPEVLAPEAYCYSAENGGFETIVNNGKVYYVAYMMAWGGAVFDVTVPDEGVEPYHVAPVLASVTNAGNSPGVRSVFFDLTGNRFMVVKMWGNLSVPQSVSEIFNPGKIDSDYKFVFLGEGKDGSTNAIFNRELPGGSKVPYLFRADFKSQEPVPLECKDLSGLDDIKAAKTFAFGTRGDFMFYASETQVRCYRYGKTNTTDVLTVGAGEKIIQMKVYVNSKDAVNNGKILFVATNGGATGKVYKIKFNEMNGIVSATPTEYTGFGNIKDMYYKE